MSIETALQSAYLGDYDQAIATLETITQSNDPAGAAQFTLARTQYGAGQSEASLATLDAYLARFPRSSRAPLALLLRAELRVDAGDLAGAAMDFAEYTTFDHVPSSYAFMRLGDIATESNDTNAAIDHYTSAIGDGLSTYTESRLMLLLVELHSSLEHTTEAAEWAERIVVSSPSTRDRVSAMEQLAQIRLQRAEDDEGIQLANSVVSHFPETAAAETLLAALGDRGVPVSPIVRAHVLLSQGALAEAELLLLNTATQSTSEQAAEAAFHLGLLRELAGDPEGALAWLERSRPDNSADYLPELTLHRLENALQTGDARAAPQLEQFALEHQGTIFAASAVEALARWHDSRSDSDGAAELWLTASRLAAQAQDLESASEFAQHAAARFAEVGDAAAASTALTALVFADPGSFEAIKAAASLANLPAYYVDEPIDSWLAEFTAPSVAVSNERLLAAAETSSQLRAAGLEFESGEATADTVSVARYGPAFLVRLGSEASREGQVGPGARAVGTLLESLPGDLQQQIPFELGELAYPRPYLQTAEDEARSTALDPLLLFSVIRQESFFDPGARSSAQARGLTQIIPSTAREIASTLGLEGFTEGDLYRPALSLAFGAYYLGAQMEAFDGYEYAALAAYNGGPANARRWGGEGGFEDPDTYLRRIDFAETFNYVRRVMENYAHYRALYQGEDRPTLPD
ncbi:MAG TPA: lytic transglycosylase domain-containing protein [Dehalococcoidia bacterium]|nr:lytic transglycosylase domain-containing protein [Dehalococcoidia bacterium]